MSLFIDPGQGGVFVVIRQLGLNLIEIMVVSAISILIMTGVLNVVINIKDSQRVSDVLSQSQENGRFGLNVVADALMQSGFYGCLPPASFTPVADYQLDMNNWQNVFYIKPVAKFASSNLSKTYLRAFSVGSSGAWIPNPSAGSDDDDLFKIAGSANVKKGTDVVSVQYASQESALLTKDMLSPADAIHIDNGLSAINQFTYLIIGDCVKADLFVVTNNPASGSPGRVLEHNANSGAKGNRQDELQNFYLKDTAEVRRFHSDTYYVAPTGRVDGLGKPIHSLMRRDVDGGTDELVEGVDSFKVEFGQQMQTGALQYKSPGAGVDWRKVSQARIELRIKLLKAAAQQQTALDGPYLEKTYTRTLQLRNRA
jgi:type IV pilus assembly protein PilW